jgi:hypothetical protein
VEGRSVLPARLTVVQIAVQRLGGHDVTALHSARSCARLSVVAAVLREDGKRRGEVEVKCYGSRLDK